MNNLATNQMTSITPPSEPALISGSWLAGDDGPANVTGNTGYQLINRQ
jgi:hypothetical protein